MICSIPLPTYLHLDRPAVEKMKPKDLYPVILALQTELVKTQKALLDAKNSSSRN